MRAGGKCAWTNKMPGRRLEASVAARWDVLTARIEAVGTGISDDDIKELSAITATMIRSCVLSGPESLKSMICTVRGHVAQGKLHPTGTRRGPHTVDGPDSGLERLTVRRLSDVQARVR